MEETELSDLIKAGVEAWSGPSGRAAKARFHALSRRRRRYGLVAAGLAAVIAGALGVGAYAAGGPSGLHRLPALEPLRETQTAPTRRPEPETPANAVPPAAETPYSSPAVVRPATAAPVSPKPAPTGTERTPEPAPTPTPKPSPETTPTPASR